MDYQDKVTIILTLKGRKNFTIRYLTYLNEINCPYKILLADGGDVNLDFQNYIEIKIISPMLIMNISGILQMTL
jgi:hypothetical protein